MTCRIRELEEESLKALNKLRDRIQELEEALEKIKDRAFKRKYRDRGHFCEAQHDVQAMYDIAHKALQDKGE